MFGQGSFPQRKELKIEREMEGNEKSSIVSNVAELLLAFKLRRFSFSPVEV